MMQVGFVAKSIKNFALLSKETTQSTTNLGSRVTADNF